MEQNEKHRHKIMKTLGLMWYPESGSDIDSQPGKPLDLASDIVSVVSKNTQALAEEAKREEQEAELLFAQYEKECIAEEEQYVLFSTNDPSVHDLNT